MKISHLLAEASKTKCASNTHLILKYDKDSDCKFFFVYYNNFAKESNLIMELVMDANKGI